MTLTARLRRHPYNYTSVMHEAAQEIERITAERDRLREALEDITPVEDDNAGRVQALAEKLVIAEQYRDDALHTLAQERKAAEKMEACLNENYESVLRRAEKAEADLAAARACIRDAGSIERGWLIRWPLWRDKHVTAIAAAWAEKEAEHD